MKCWSCETEIPEEATFCRYCGRSQSDRPESPHGDPPRDPEPVDHPPAEPTPAAPEERPRGAVMEDDHEEGHASQRSWWYWAGAILVAVSPWLSWNAVGGAERIVRGAFYCCSPTSSPAFQLDVDIPLIGWFDTGHYILAFGIVALVAGRRGWPRWVPVLAGVLTIALAGLYFWVFFLSREFGWTVADDLGIGIVPAVVGAVILLAVPPHRSNRGV